jgi:hypothetical protein
MAVAARMCGGGLALALTALAACGAPPPADRAASEKVVLAPEEVLAESNASIVYGRNQALANLTKEVAPPTPEEAAAGAIIPARFHGRWDSSREACARATSEMRLVVAGTSMRFYESVGEVITVRSAGDTVAVDLRTSGEGETRAETRALRLTSDGRLVVQSGATSATRLRCPN